MQIADDEFSVISECTCVHIPLSSQRTHVNGILSSVRQTKRETRSNFVNMCISSRYAVQDMRRVVIIFNKKKTFFLKLKIAFHSTSRETRRPVYGDTIQTQSPILHLSADTSHSVAVLDLIVRILFFSCSPAFLVNVFFFIF